MPTYLVHGFRWSRPYIRVFVILENIDDASPDWIVRPATMRSLLDTLYTKFDFLPPRPPEAVPDKAAASLLDVQAGHPVKFVEEFDPTDLAAVAPPHAYVADHVVPVSLSVSVTDEIAAYEQRLAAARSGKTLPAMVAEPAGEAAKSGKKSKAKTPAGGGWLERLRDQLQEGAPIGWYVVVNGDEQRGWQTDDGEAEEAEEIRDAEDAETKWPMDPTQAPAAATAEDERARALRQLRYEIGGFGSDDDDEIRRDVDGEEGASLSTAATTTTTSPPDEHRRPSSSSTGLGRLLKSRQRSRSRSGARHHASPPPPSSGRSSPKPPPVPPIPASTSSTPPSLRRKASSSFRRLFGRSRTDDLS